MTYLYGNLLPRLQNARDAIRNNRMAPKDRLSSAYLDYLFPLLTNEFPPHVRPLWDELQAAMRKVPDTENGSARASIAAMTSEELKAISDLVVRICDEVEHAG